MRLKVKSNVSENTIVQHYVYSFSWLITLKTLMWVKKFFSQKSRNLQFVGIFLESYPYQEINPN